MGPTKKKGDWGGWGGGGKRSVLYGTRENTKRGETTHDKSRNKRVKHFWGEIGGEEGQWKKEFFWDTEANRGGKKGKTWGEAGDENQSKENLSVETNEKVAEKTNIPGSQKKKISQHGIAQGRERGCPV